MDSVLRVVAMYGFLLLVLRISGKRTLAETDTFDLLTLLIISETTQQAMVDQDHSITNAFLMISTLVGLTILLSVLKQRFKWFNRVIDDVPLIILENGTPLKDRMDKSRVDEDDILEAARQIHGLERLDQVKFAVLERSGAISIIPHQRNFG